MSRLLIMGCSQRKLATPGLTPALQRYDGGNFRVLKKFIRENGRPQNLTVLILSAQYGLLLEKDLIEDYDQRMTPRLAASHAEQVAKRLEMLYTSPYAFCEEAFVVLGADYRPAINMDQVRQIATNVSEAIGPMGVQASQLKAWLATLPTASLSSKFRKKP